MFLKILELRNNRKRGKERTKGSGELRRRRVSLVTQSLKRGGLNALFISLPRPLKDRLLLTGTAPLSICCLEKLPTSQLIFPDSLLSFLLSPFGGRGIVHFAYYWHFGNYVTATVETTRRAYGFARD